MKKVLLIICLCLLFTGCDNKTNDKKNKVTCIDEGDNYSYKVVLNVSNDEVISIETTYRFNNFSKEEAEKSVEEGCPVETDSCETLVDDKDSVFRWTIDSFEDFDSNDLDDIKDLYIENGYYCE